MSQQTPAGWFPDPFGRHEHRWWDGIQWTEHVGSAGSQTVDAPVIAPPTQAHSHPALVNATKAVNVPADKRVQEQVRKLGVSDAAQTGGGTLFTEQILVVNQKAKLFERRAEYAVFNQHGQKVGGVKQFGTSMSGMIVGRDNATKRLQIVDAAGDPS